MMRQAPLGHDRAAARDDAGDAVGGEVDVGEPHAGMDGEIIDALLALLDQRVLVAFPVEFYRVAVDLLQRLIDRHGADRDRRIAQNPFARVVDVAARGEVHHRVGAPADRPHHLLHFLFHRRRDGGVADIGVDLGEEVPADDHRLQLGVIDVRRNDGAAARHFRTHEFRRDEQRHSGAKTFAVVMGGLRGLQHFFAAEIFALGDVDHFLGDDAGARPFELGEGFFPSPLWGGARGGGREVSRRRRWERLPLPTPHPALPRQACSRARIRATRLGGGRNGAERPGRIRKAARQMLAADVAVIDRLDRPALVLLDAAALAHPGGAGARQALFHVDLCLRVGVGAGGIVDRNRRLAGRGIKRNLAQRHFQIGRRLGRRIDLA